MKMKIMLAICAAVAVVQAGEREDGLKVGALKSEAIKDGQPDWSPKSISLISVGK